MCLGKRNKRATSGNKHARAPEGSYTLIIIWAFLMALCVYICTMYGTINTPPKTPACLCASDECECAISVPCGFAAGHFLCR